MFPKHVEQYFDITAKQRQIYTDKCIVLMQVGSFFEAYGLPPADESLSIRVCTDILGFLTANKGTVGTPDHHLMAGFPVLNVRRNLKLLLEHNYTVVFVEQKGEPPNIRREITRTVSPGLNLSEDVHETTDVGQSVLLSVMLEEDRDGDCYAHLCIFDSNRGTVRLEAVSCVSAEHATDLNQKLDVERVLGGLRDATQTVEYHELCVYTRGRSEAFRTAVQRFVDHLEREEKLVHVHRMHTQKDACWFNRTVQAEQLERFYPKHRSGFCTIWERLGMLRTDPACVALLVRTLTFVYDHDPRLVLDLNPPVSHQEGVVQRQEGASAHTDTATDAPADTPMAGTSTRDPDEGRTVQCFNELYAKLNMLDTRTKLTTSGNTQTSSLRALETSRLQQSTSPKTASLFALLNNTRTVMGRQLLSERLMHVSVSPRVMESRWDLVSALLDPSGDTFVPNELYGTLQQHLRSVDLERMYRRFRLGQLNPTELPRIVQSQRNLLEVVDYVITSLAPDHPFRALLPDQCLHSRLREYQAELEALFDLEQCAHMHFQAMHTSVFRRGPFPDVDQACTEHEQLTGLVDTLAQTLMDAAPDMVATKTKGSRAAKHGMHSPGNGTGAARKTRHSPSTSDSAACPSPLEAKAWIKVKSNEKDGFWLELTRQRCDALRKRLDSTPTLRKQFIEEMGLRFDCSKKSVARITCPRLSSLSEDIQRAHDRLVELVQAKYTQTLQSLYDTHYEPTIKPLQQAVSQYDVAFSSATAASTFGYVRPTLDYDAHAKQHGRVDIVALRHPLIERLLATGGSKLSYVANDVHLSPDQGWLLHGVNSVGKSSLLKGIAVAVLMAQAGMFVAAASMRFSPYTKIFSRTGNNDNLHRAQSSFVKEMSESQAIACCADARSLVVADELCASTERISAVCIVSTLLKLLSNRGASYVFATHLFDLQTHHYVQQLLQHPHPERSRLRNFFLDVGFDQAQGQCIFHRTLQPGLPANRQYGIVIADNIVANTEFSALLKGAATATATATAGAADASPSNSMNTDTSCMDTPGTDTSCTGTPCTGTADTTDTADSLSMQLQSMSLCHRSAVSSAPATRTPTNPFRSASPFIGSCTPAGASTSAPPTPYTTSRYNAQVLMTECSVCHYRPPTTDHVPMDTHHIHEQQHADKTNGLIQNRFHKHARHNLVPLCKPCHRKIDTGELVVHGYVQTASGPVLKFETHAPSLGPPEPEKGGGGGSKEPVPTSPTRASLPNPVPAVAGLAPAGIQKNERGVGKNSAAPPPSQVPHTTGDKKTPSGRQTKFTDEVVAEIRRIHAANPKKNTTKKNQWCYTRDAVESALGVAVGYTNFWKFVDSEQGQDQGHSLAPCHTSDA